LVEADPGPILDASGDGLTPGPGTRAALGGEPLTAHLRALAPWTLAALTIVAVVGLLTAR
jgi:hypothetical protein